MTILKMPKVGGIISHRRALINFVLNCFLLCQQTIATYFCEEQRELVFSEIMMGICNSSVLSNCVDGTKHFMNENVELSLILIV